MRSYRIDQPKPKPKHRSFQSLSTPNTLYIHNGNSAILAIPCYYMEVRPPVPARLHDRMRHDMLGWPTPDHPDHVCQEWDFDRHHCRRTPHLKCCPPRCEHFLDMRRLIPIHLLAEGYREVQIEVVDEDGEKLSDDSSLRVTGVIDERDDWVIRIFIETHVPGVIVPSDGEKTFYYSVNLVYLGDIDNYDGDGRSRGRMQLAAMGKIVVLPAPFGPGIPA